MKRKLLTLTLVILIALGIPITVFAQDYYFSLDKMVVDVYWNADGTSSLDYRLTFSNQPGGHAIEFVDVGMPNSNFSLADVQAEINGQPLNVSSDFQGSGSSGFAVEMGSYAIPPGGSGTVHVFVRRVTGVLYKDDKDANYASAVFAPLYFQSNVITGSTDITVTYHLPPGVQPQEPRWHAAPAGFPSEPVTGFDNQDRITYAWRNPQADASRQYKFGASFPKTYIPADSIVTVSLPSFSISSDTVFSLLCLGFFGFMFIGIPTLTALGARRRKMQYLPPKISIEGHGIKRGLTAVEAAILMEQPLDKVMTMILFGAVKKEAAEVRSRNPLELDVTSPMPDSLREYERQFLNAFKENNKKTRRELLQTMTVSLVRSVSEKMKGFSRRETVEYYKSIMEKAWQQVEQANTPEVQKEIFEQALEWTMLDKDYDDRSRRTFTRPIIVPAWRRTGSSTSTSTPTPSFGGGTGLPGADFAASVVTGVQSFSQSVIGNVNEFTSKITNVTNPPPPPSRSSGGRSGGGGGRSCACACACAGCACACAGGGR